MGWAVGVHEVVMHAAYCNEEGCDFRGELTDRDSAESAARAHRHEHARRYSLYNELLETGHPLSAAEAVRTGRAEAIPHPTRRGHLQVLWPKTATR